jgi:exodeoxyribonuclease-3
MALRVTTWNINSVRLRQDLVLRVLRELDPDLLCLQEIKVETELFPHDPYEQAGYPHRAVFGQKGYHGVAILSKRPFERSDSPNWCEKGDCRHLAVRVDGIEVHNFYVPSGGDIPDPAVNEKFAHKLAFVDEVEAWFGANRRASDRMILVGDLNIAPLEHDVWSHKQLLDVVSHTPIEVEKLTRLQRRTDWVDAVRHFVPEEQKLYSWWSYRARDWRLSNRGRRLDHIWVTPPLKSALQAHSILTEARGWERSSDHVPVTVDLAV